VDELNFYSEFVQANIEEEKALNPKRNEKALIERIANLKLASHDFLEGGRLQKFPIEGQKQLDNETLENLCLPIDFVSKDRKTILKQIHMFIGENRKEIVKARRHQKQNEAPVQNKNLSEPTQQLDHHCRDERRESLKTPTWKLKEVRRNANDRIVYMNGCKLLVEIFNENC
jgi:hypothetical protein